VKEAIMTDINNLVQEFWRTSSDGAVEAPFFEMRRLLGILQKCFDYLDVCFDIIANAVNLTNKNLQPNSSFYPSKSDLDEFGAKFKTLLDGYCKMFDQSLFKSKDLGDMLRFLPGIVVQNRMSMQEMADFYRIKPDLLKRLIKSTIEPLKTSYTARYVLDDYLSGFLQDRDRSQLYYCDPMLQHISICRRLLSLVLGGSNALDLLP
jgi:hypothetical protein